MAGKPSLMQISKNRGGSSVTSVSSSNSPSREMDVSANCARVCMCVCVCVCVCVCGWVGGCVIEFLKGVKTGEL